MPASPAPRAATPPADPNGGIRQRRPRRTPPTPQRRRLADEDWPPWGPAVLVVRFQDRPTSSTPRRPVKTRLSSIDTAHGRLSSTPRHSKCPRSRRPLEISRPPLPGRSSAPLAARDTWASSARPRRFRLTPRPAPTLIARRTHSDSPPPFQPIRPLLRNISTRNSNLSTSRTCSRSSTDCTPQQPPRSPPTFATSPLTPSPTIVWGRGQVAGWACQRLGKRGGCGGQIRSCVRTPFHSAVSAQVSVCVLVVKGEDWGIGTPV